MNTPEAIVVAVNKSHKRGIKQTVNSIKLVPGGIEGDAHQYSGHREVSLLDEKHINDFLRISNASEHPGYGSFAENITTKNLPEDIRIYDYLIIGNAVLMVTQLGKPFHETLEFPGHYVSPQKAVFCQVLKEGSVESGNTIIHKPRTFRTLIVTLSDRAAKGIYKDQSGPKAEEIMMELTRKEQYRTEISKQIIPDDRQVLKDIMQTARDFDFILTTGGTGISEKDLTTETVKPYLDKEIPGITEMIRWKYGLEKPQTLLSGSLAGTIGKTLVFCMPGNPKAVEEYMQEFIKVIPHALRMVHGLNH